MGDKIAPTAGGSAVFVENEGVDLPSDAPTRQPPKATVERRVTRSQTAPKRESVNKAKDVRKPVPKKTASGPKTEALLSSNNKLAAIATSKKRSAKTIDTSHAKEKVSASATAAALEPKSKRRRAVVPEANATASIVMPSEPADVFVFGSNPFGALGLGEDETVKYRPAQVSVDGDSGFIQVSCGGMHTIALASDGTVWTWGVNDEGALGRKTDGTCWEDSTNKGDAYVPGRAEIPSSAGPVTQVWITVTCAYLTRSGSMGGSIYFNFRLYCLSPQVVAGDGFSFVLAGGSVYGCGIFKDDQGGINGFCGKSPGLQV